MLNIVTSFNIVNLFKRSRYFVNNLGLVATIEKNGRRIYNDRDKFSHFYNSRYKTTIYAQGNIGDIRFYTDHYINNQTIAVYYTVNFEEFILNLNQELIKEKGIDFYIGSIIKEVEEKYEERVKNKEIKKIEQSNEGNPDIITKNPGAVTYADVKAYLKNKQNKRLL